MSTTPLRFGPFELDPIRRALLRDGVPVRLRPMAIALLCHLAQERERIVPKDELLQTLWPDGTGSEANLTVTVAAVRKALGEINGQHRMLITVPREGYQFVAEIDEGDAARNEMPRHLALLPLEIRKEATPERVEAVGRVREYLARHARCLAGLKIETPDSEAIGSGSMVEIVARLNVSGILLGTLETRGDSTQLDLKIVDHDGHDRWHTQIAHPTEELHTLAIRAAREVVLVLNPTPGQRPRAASPPRNENSEAWRSYVQGKYHYASGDGLPGLHRAAVAFQRAVDLEPDLTPAQAGLGESLLLLRAAAMIEPDSTAQRVHDAAHAAFRRDPINEDAHMLMAQVCMILQHDWSAAREHLLSALEFGPDNAWVHAKYASYLAWRRQFEASLDSIRRAQSLDPFSMRITADVARIHHFAGQTGVALSILESATSRKLEFVTGWMLMTWFHLGLGDAEQALEALENVRPQLDSTALWDVFTGVAHGIAGRAEPAHAALSSLRNRRERGESIPPQFEATILLALRDLEAATERIQRSAEERYGEFPAIEADPFWAPLRSWPGYEPIRLRYFGKRLIDH
jgi:DNA-binding winged helix-turn-helix (wHTH) protein/tetratricopeptide (TPR) repeat protein